MGLTYIHTYIHHKYPVNCFGFFLLLISTELFSLVLHCCGPCSQHPTLTVCKMEGRHEMDEQEANDQNKSSEAPKNYKLPEAYDLLEEQMKDSDRLEA